MRKYSKSLLGLILVCTLLFGMVMPVFAETEQTVTPVLVRTAKEYERGKVTSTGITISPTDNESVVPIAVSAAGRLDLTLSAKAGVLPFIFLDCNLYADEACTKKIGYSMDLVYGAASVSGSYYLTGKTTVYLKMVQHRNTGITGPGHYQLKSVLYSGETRTLKADTSYLAAVENADQEGLYKVTVSKSGLMTFTVDGTADKKAAIYTTLCNSKKEAISGESYLVGDGSVSKVYAAAKGTYYIKLRIASANNELVKISYTNTVCKDESGASVSKAVTLKSGTAKSGYLGASSKKGNADWYKVKLTKAGKLTVDVDAIGDSSVMLMITDKAGKEAWYGSKRIQVGENSFTTAKLAKGTYYIKVYKDTAKAGLSYQIKVK